MNAFLRRDAPTLTAMVQAGTPDDVIALIGEAIGMGADALGIQTCRLNPADQTIENYKRIFEAAKGLPTYVTHYRSYENQGKTDEQLAEGMLKIADCGATLVDVMGDLFAPHPDELCTDEEAVEKQRKLIDAIHARGAQVLMSSHTHKYMSVARILEIARAQEARGADIVKIVTKADSPEEEAEVLLANAVLKRELKVPFLLLCGGVCRTVRRVGPMLGSCMWLSVPRHDEYATKVQPLISDILAVKKGFEEEKDNV